MAKSTLTDEEKAKLIAGDVDSEKKDETTDANGAESEEEQDDSAAEDQTEESQEEASTEEDTESETAQTFTKQFPNLKGETEAEYIKELEQAYTNSTTEAIRLKREAEARNAAPTEPAAPQGQQQQPQPPTNPDLQYAKSLREREMNEAFDKFAKSYPNVRESADFDRFAAASDGINATYRATHNGADAPFDWLYEKIASALDWEPIGKTAKKDAAIKNSGVSSSTQSSRATVPKQPNVSDKEIETYLKMFPLKSVEDARKEIAEVKA